MTIEQADSVDGLGVDREAGEVVLLISDHLPWRDEAPHFSALERKLANYLEFIQSGQVFGRMPEARGMSIRIKLLHQHKPSTSSERVLIAIREQLAEMNVRFSFEALPNGY